MSPRSGLFATLMFAALVLPVLAGAGCSRSIGDGCTANVECSPLGDRFCDVGSPGGYCTVDGCDYNTCPDNAVCVRFFSLQRSTTTCTIGLQPLGADECKDPARQGCCVYGAAKCCQAGQLCLSDERGQGYCADERTERRWCMHPCNSGGDCRDGYSCFTTGQSGAVPVPYKDDSGVYHYDNVSYCAPAQPTPGSSGGSSG